MDKAKYLAETIREMSQKMKAISDATGWEISEAFVMTERFENLFYDMIGASYCDWNYTKFRDYELGEIDYSELLEAIIYDEQ